MGKPPKLPDPPYIEVLRTLVVLHDDLRRLETHALQVMNDCGITDEDIGEVLGISSQAVGKRRRRKIR